MKKLLALFLLAGCVENSVGWFVGAPDTLVEVQGHNMKVVAYSDSNSYAVGPSSTSWPGKKTAIQHEQMVKEAVQRVTGCSAVALAKNVSNIWYDVQVKC